MFSVSFSQTGLFFIFQSLLCAIFSRLTHEQQVGTSRNFQKSISLIPVHGGEQLIFIFSLTCITPHRTFLSHLGRVISSQFDSCQRLWPAMNLQIPKPLFLHHRTQESGGLSYMTGDKGSFSLSMVIKEHFLIYKNLQEGFIIFQFTCICSSV